jgi:uncharacterized protein with ParB-like and HNH nuclease domain
LLSDIEKGEIKIPQFQRDFVWSIQKSAALLDSIIKGYPIGTFIFWATKDRFRSVRDLGNIKLPDPKEGEVVSFVLDGQQRITSLFATLKGLKVQRASGKEDDFSDIYVDLQAKPDEQIVITDLIDKSKDACIRLTDLLYGGLEKLTAYPKAHHQKLDEYKQRIQSYDFSTIEVRDVPIDVATEIFTRINVGGIPLSLFEIMVAKDRKIGKLPSAFGCALSRTNRCINFVSSRCCFDDRSFDVSCRRKQHVDQVIQSRVFHRR